VDAFHRFASELEQDKLYTGTAQNERKLTRQVRSNSDEGEIVFMSGDALQLHYRMRGWMRSGLAVGISKQQTSLPWRARS
jgi:hypothetical protein